MATGIIAGLEQAAPLFKVTPSTYFKISAGTSIAGAMAEAIDTGNYTQAFAEGLTGWASGQAATAAIALAVAGGATISTGGAFAIVAGATALGTVLGRYLYVSNIAPNIDMAALGNSIGQAINATVATPGLSIANTAAVLEQNLLTTLQNSPNANLPFGKDLISIVQSLSPADIENINQQVIASQNSPSAATMVSLSEGSDGTLSFVTTSVVVRNLLFCEDFCEGAVRCKITLQSRNRVI
jgi:hypothetical protein